MGKSKQDDGVVWIGDHDEENVQNIEELKKKSHILCYK
jgi:hypothetical protein